jgi:methanogenic corrinoid protein MtbC1
MLRALEGSQAEAGQRPGYDLGALLERLLDASVRLDEAGASQALAEALTVAPVETVALELVQPVLHAIGERWASGDLSVTVEHFSSNILRNQIAQLLRISPAPIRAAQIVVACAPGELHDVGALMLALFLRRRGWDVVFVGASVEPEDFIADVALIQPTAVLISASRAEMALGMEAMLRELSAQYQGILGLGGRAFNVEPELRGALPGIYLGNDAAQATAALEDALLNAGRGAV